MKIIDLKNSEGISLIEILLGITIIAILSISVSYYFTNAATATVETEQRAQATKMAKDVMERLTDTISTDVSNAGDIASSFNFNSVKSNYSLRPGEDYVLNISLDSFDFNNDNDTDNNDNAIGRKVTVKVRWNSGNNSVSLTKLIREW